MTPPDPNTAARPQGLEPPPGEEGEALREGLLVKDAEPENVVHQRSEYLQRIYMLIRLRWYAIAALLVTITFTTMVGQFQFSLVPPVIVLISTTCAPATSVGSSCIAAARARGRS